MGIWLITFGQRFARETHPTSRIIHPDGVVAIYAENEEHARKIAFKHFGKNWSTVRSLADLPNFTEFFPRGVIGQVMKTTGELSFTVKEDFKQASL